jgi:hypothetical protein
MGEGRAGAELGCLFECSGGTRTVKPKDTTVTAGMPGSCLGLAIVRQVAESDAGTVTAGRAKGRRHAHAAEAERRAYSA